MRYYSVFAFSSCHLSLAERRLRRRVCKGHVTLGGVLFMAGAQRTCGAVYNHSMAKNVIRVSEAEAASDFATLLARVSAGAEIVIEKDKRAIAVLHPAEPVRRTISECIALLPEDSTATIDADFPKDVETAVASLREPLSPPAWD